MRIFCGSLLLVASAFADTAVPREGPILTDGIVADARKREVVLADERRPFEHFLLVERDDGTCLWAPDFESRLRSYLRIVFEGRRNELVELAKEAVRARDAKTARRLYEWAKKEGLEGRDERIVRKRIENLEKRSRRINERRIAPVLEAEKKLREQLPEFLLARVKKAEATDALRVLDALLRRAPDHEEARAMLEARVPAEHPFGDAESWLTWHLELERRGFRLAPKDLHDLKRARHYWRPDLYGIATDRILLITPIRRLDAVAQCAQRIEITVRELQRLFETEKPFVRTKRPVTVHLFENGKNFTERVGYKRPTDLPPWFDWELGTWDLRDDLCRFFCPKTMAPDSRQLAYTIVHEVTLYWLWTRCPRYITTDLYKSGDPSGYGVAIGLAGFLGEAPFDFERKTIDYAAKGTPSLRVVASKKLIRWRKFFLMNQKDVVAMHDRDPNLKKNPRTGMLLGHKFMMQGAAVCHYLFNAQGERHREALIDYITAHYRGQQKKMNPLAAFGLSGDDLGKAVVAYAK